MKQGRQSAILEIIENHNVETQDQLSEILGSMGFEVTQATISRDIKELKLLKVQGEGGVYKYAVAGKGQLGKLDVFKRVFRDTVVSVEQAASLVVVRTMTGSANAAAEAIDELDMPEVAGSLAGDNTIFIAVKQEGMQKRVIDELAKMMRPKR
jgi:transcriptional regulator of arginine metabolism